MILSLRKLSTSHTDRSISKVESRSLPISKFFAHETPICSIQGGLGRLGPLFEKALDFCELKSSLDTKKNALKVLTSTFVESS